MELLDCKRQMTWRVWAASLIAIAIRIVGMAVLHYMMVTGNLMENIPHLSGLLWLLFGVVYLLSFLSIYIPLKRPSVGSGVFYLITIIILIFANLLWNGCILYNYPIESIFL